MEYIRNVYGVPAKVGGRVKFIDKLGTIVSSYGSYIKVRLDGEDEVKIYHPNWQMEYLEDSCK